MRKTAILLALACAFARADYGPGTTDSDLLRSGTPVVTNAWLAVSNETARLVSRVAGDASRITDGTNTIDAARSVWQSYSGRVCTNANEAWTYSVGGATYTAEQMTDAFGGGDSDHSQTLVWMNSSFIGKDGEEEQFEGWFVIDGSGSRPVGYSYITGETPESSADHFLALAEYVGLDYTGGTNVSITAFRGTFESGTKYVGRLALTNDIPASVFADLTPATNYANQVCARVAGEATNYADAVALEFESGARVAQEANYASSANSAYGAFYLYDDGQAGEIHPSDIMRGATNAAIAVSAGKQDALPYPTNAIPYAAISGTPTLSGYATHAQVAEAAVAATNYTDGAISTNNAAFVAAVTNCPVVIASGGGGGDGFPAGDWSDYGTLGALLAAIVAAITWLKNNQRYALHTVTLTNGAGTLLDRAGNRVVVSGDTTLTLPALEHAGRLRDFLVRLEISGSTVPTITFQPDGNESVTYETDGDEFPVPDEAGDWLYSFTESCVAHKFAVSLKKINEVAAPQAQGGA